MYVHVYTYFLEYIRGQVSHKHFGDEDQKWTRTSIIVTISMYVKIHDKNCIQDSQGRAQSHDLGCFSGRIGNLLVWEYHGGVAKMLAIVSCSGLL